MKLIEVESNYRGYAFTVRQNGMGYRCGYVCIPKGHPWYDKDCDSIECDCHGGLTFARHCKDGEDDLCEGFWIGFDCAHSFDSPDLSLVSEEYKKLDIAHVSALTGSGTIRSLDYAEQECRCIIDQAIEADK